MTRRRRWFLTVLAVFLVLGAATSIALVLRPCEAHTVVLLNATPWAAEVTLQIGAFETGPKYTVWSGTAEARVPPLRVPIGALYVEGSYAVSVRFPETGQSIPELGFGYTSAFMSMVSFFLIRDEDVIYTFWNEPRRTDEPEYLWNVLSDMWIVGARVMSCVGDGLLTYGPPGDVTF